MKKSIRMPYKVLSFCLAVIIISVSVPFAFAATALNASNVVTWPTIEGEIFLGQKLSDGLKINNENILVTTDGTEIGTTIAGTFEFINPDFIPTTVGQINADIKFTPTDNDTYYGFEVENSESVLYTVKELTPVLVDENDPPVATEVEAGARLSTSKISGGSVKNPITNEILEDAVWAWKSSRTKVNESGYYPAYAVSPSIDYPLMLDIYVRIAGDVPETSITENPTADVTYDPDLKWGDVELQGGKAVIKGTDTEVAGTFTVTDKFKNVTPTTSQTKIEVVFTPDDETQALPYTFEIPVTVNQAVPALKADVSSITMPYGAKIDSSLDVYVKNLVDVEVPVYLDYKDLDGNDLEHKGTTPKVGEHDVSVRISIHDSNYQPLTMLTYRLIITPITINPAMVVVDADNYKIVDESLAYNHAKPQGTFTVAYTINGEKQPEITAKYGDAFKVDDSRSGEYIFTVSYNKVEDDPFVIESFEMRKTEIYDRKVIANGSASVHSYGAAVSVAAPATDPEKKDKPYYLFKEWSTVEGIEMTDEQKNNPEVSFTMPDNDVKLEASYKFNFCACIRYYVQVIVDFFTSFFNSIGTLF